MLSWRDSIIDALTRIGGEAPYQEIYAEIAARRKSLPPSWQAIVRRTIQQSSSDSSAFRPSNGDLFRTVSGLGQGRWGLRDARADSGLEGFVAETGGVGQGYVVDSVVRRSIERHAVRLATDHYWAQGALEVTELGKPYDLNVRFEQSETHVEVKGSTRTLDVVTLTRNEVAHASGTPGTELFVVDKILLTTDEEGNVETQGGRKRLWRSWVPSPESLTGIVFAHSLGAGAQLLS